MEQKIILGAISTICIDIITNYIYDKIKNHSKPSQTKSGMELELKFKFKISKK